MTPEQHANVAIDEATDYAHYLSANEDAAWLKAIAAVIREHEAEVRQEYEAARQSIKRPPDELLR